MLEQQRLCRVIEQRYRDLLGYRSAGTPRATSSSDSTQHCCSKRSNNSSSMRSSSKSVDPASISDTDALFGAGLNLDSIDALELATAIARKYDITGQPGPGNARCISLGRPSRRLCCAETSRGRAAHHVNVSNVWLVPIGSSVTTRSSAVAITSRKSCEWYMRLVPFAMQVK